MASASLELLGFFMGLAGLVGNLVTTALPFWEVSVEAGAAKVTARDTNMNGLWMRCSNKLNGAFLCEMYKSFLMMPSDLRISRLLMLTSLGLSVVGLLVAATGMKCTVCMKRCESCKRRVAGIGGILLFAAGMVALVPVSWTANIVIRNFPTSSNVLLKFVPGSCLYLGMASSVLSVLGGGILALSFFAGKCCGRRRGGYTYKGHAVEIPFAMARNPTIPVSRGQMLVGGGGGAGSYPGALVKPGGSMYTRYM
ncbi:claudin-9-like [Syngnathus scovelli]|uniref:claudin-9-like n=1 Tax=Syngnathus scovelli TaxID=161590 RepID=UPI0021106C28|nr:claudin-9-like [Syngnathus scovelli]